MKLAALLALLILLTAPGYILIDGATAPSTEPLTDWLKILALAVFVAVRARFWDTRYKLEPRHA